MTTTSSSESSLAQQSRSKLKEVLYSPSGKLTLSPEVIIPEPSDPTALLLQSSFITQLSNDMRSKAKANAMFLSGSLSSLQQIANEQEEARGSFPGPIPLIYCPNSSNNDNDEEEETTLFSSIAENGGCGIFRSVCSGRAIQSVDELKDESWMKEALSHGIQPIPEVTLNMEKEWTVEDIDTLVDMLTENCGTKEGPVCVVLSMDNDDNNNDDDSFWNNVPKISKAMNRKTPILASVKADSSDQLSDYNAHFKTKSFAGVLLKADCVPGYRMNPDLQFVSQFWNSVISNLKSTKSKTFQLRTKSNMERSVPQEWMNYQKDVMESGALGENSARSSMDELNPEKGDFKAF